MLEKYKTPRSLYKIASAFVKATAMAEKDLNFFQVLAWLVTFPKTKLEGGAVCLQV